MMMHPAAVKTIKDVISSFTSPKRPSSEDAFNWVTAKI
jgi:CO dehydrogenase/acetyl-CoA synthase delta subunit